MNKFLLLILATTFITLCGCLSVAENSELKDREYSSLGSTVQFSDRSTNIQFKVNNDSEAVLIEDAFTKQVGDDVLLYVNLKLTRISRIPFDTHVHFEVFDKNGKRLDSSYQYIRHRHLISRYLGHRHRARFAPEAIAGDLAEIGRIELFVHSSKV